MTPNQFSPMPGAPAPNERAEAEPAATASSLGLVEVSNGSHNGAATLPRSNFENDPSTRNEDEVERRRMRRHFQEEWE